MGKRSRERDDARIEDVRDVEGGRSFDGVSTEGVVRRMLLMTTVSRVLFEHPRVDGGGSDGGLSPVGDG